jgi:hypothetical protein
MYFGNAIADIVYFSATSLMILEQDLQNGGRRNVTYQGEVGS